jgi:Zn-dependent protease
MEHSLLLYARDPEQMIAVLVALVIGMTVHEFAHSYAAHLMGDPTPSQMGRLTLNPLVHINWFGWLMFIIVGFGILGQAPMNPARMRNPRWGALIAVAAGPISNLLLAVVAAIIFRILTPLFMGGSLPSIISTILFFSVLYNVILIMFNLLPLFPIDGWHIVFAPLPPEQARVWGSYQWRQYSQYALFGLILLSFTGINILGQLVFQPSIALTRLLIG